ncbi:MAG TPA: hypothetical protein DDZ88_27050 [Verrucomicrobiales bacterium]|nr:hypothetical protein [Verrucomicrobiales bacterium]
MTRLAFVLDGGREVLVPLAGDMPLGHLAEVTAAVEDAQTANQQWQESLRLLCAEHQQKAEALRVITGLHETKCSEVSRLQAAEAAARSELESLTARQDQTLTQFQELSGRCALNQVRAEALEREISVLQERCQAGMEAAEFHEARIKDTTHELGQLELSRDGIKAELQTRGRELADTEEKLRHARTQCEEETARYQELSAAVRIFAEQRQQSAAVVHELESRIDRLRGEYQQAVGNTLEARAAQQHAETDRRGVQADLKVHQDRLASTQAEHAATQARLDTTNEKLSATELDLDARRQELASANQSLDIATTRLSATEHTLAAAELSLASVEEKLATTGQRFDFSAQALAATEEELATRQDLLSDTRRQLTVAETALASTTQALQDTRQNLGATEQRHTDASARLATTEQELQACSQALASTEEKLATTRQKLTAALEHLGRTEEDIILTSRHLAASEAQLDDSRDALAVTEQSLRTHSRQLRDTRQALLAKNEELLKAGEQLASQQQQTAASETRQAEVQAVVSLGEARIATFQGALDSLRVEEEATRTRIENLNTQERDLRSGLQRLGAAERTERARYEETRSIAEEAEKERLAREEEMNRNTAAVRQELAELEARLLPLRDWKERMDQCNMRLAPLPPDSLEARNLRNEIEMAMAGLRHLLSCVPQGRARSMSAPQSASASGTGLEAALNARLNRLRETMQREESRLEFLRQERERQELRARTRPAIDPALREQESKIRLAQEQLAMVEAKVKRAAVEEQNHREKIATLKLQLAELRAEFTTARETNMPLAS